MCVSDSSKPVTVGQTGSAHLKAACYNNIPREDSTAFQQTEINLLRNYLKNRNPSKSCRATETAEQWKSNQKEEEQTESLWPKNLQEESCNENTFPYHHPVITCQMSPNYCPDTCSWPRSNVNHQLHLWVLLWEKGWLFQWNNLHRKIMAGSLLDHFTHRIPCTDTRLILPVGIQVPLHQAAVS